MFSTTKYQKEFESDPIMVTRGNYVMQLQDERQSLRDTHRECVEAMEATISRLNARIAELEARS